MFYQKSVSAIRAYVKKVFPQLEPREERPKPGYKASPAYLLWMCREIESMDTSSEEMARKAGRWIGWVYAHAELLGFWDNKKSQDLAREDKDLGLDKPHQR